jgi:hypothetical protein
MIHVYPVLVSRPTFTYLLIYRTKSPEFHLRDLKTILPSCLPKNGEMVNIMGCIAMAARMRDLIKFRTPQVAPEPERMDYLLKQLASIEVSTTTSDELHQRSRSLKAREIDFSKSRARALEVIGVGV